MAFRLLVTAGPTREPIDAVRFISNRSTGRMGYAVARAAVEAGAEVRLITGPVALDPPPGAEIFPVETAEEMAQAVDKHFPWCQGLVMTAAVADYRPEQRISGKLKKGGDLVLPLVRTRDILGSIAPHKARRLVVGFAVESEDLKKRAGEKLKKKGLDMIVANDVSSFAVERSTAHFITEAGVIRTCTKEPKEKTAKELVAWMLSRKKASDP